MITAFQVSSQVLGPGSNAGSLPTTDPVSLAVDASDLAIGGVLQQWVNNQ